MLINVFSTHRTGSTWWCHYLINKNPGGIFYNELFNQVTYFAVGGNDKYIPFNEYKEGYYWRSPNNACKRLLHHYYKVPDEYEGRYERWIKYLEFSPEVNICHTHLWPLRDSKYLAELCKIGDKNYYVYRENILEQMASLIIMEHTGEYTVVTKEKSNISEKFTYPIIDMKTIEWKMKEILHAEEFIADKLFNYERIKYESMPFHETVEGMPLKQNVSAFDRLCIIDQVLLKQIYGRTKNVR